MKPEFDRSISIDFRGAKITSDTGFLIMREIDQRFNILNAAASQIGDPRSARHTDHSLLELLRQRVYQVAAGYEDCNDADHLRIDPALRLALGKEHESGAGQSALCRFENKILVTPQGLNALEKALTQSADTLPRRRNKRRLIIDVHSTEDPVHGKQEGAAFNGYFDQLCYYPLFCLTNKGDLLSARLRPGNTHSAQGVLDLISPLVERYRSWFKQFRLLGDAAFAGPDLYEFCEGRRITYFIRISSNSSLKSRIGLNLKRPAGRPPKSGVQVGVIEFHYQAEKWNKPRRVVCKIEWHVGGLFPRVGFIVTNS
ncbi:MAG TPA: IS1380 family transposase, partial [Syntrophobacteraceae bacterium]|nr:IS1380 family transposase [Syntrophobacteraceae bacterium]